MHSWSFLRLAPVVCRSCAAGASAVVHWACTCGLQELCRRCIRYNASCGRAWECLGAILEREQAYKVSTQHRQVPAAARRVRMLQLVLPCRGAALPSCLCSWATCPALLLQTTGYTPLNGRHA